jgi:hypothetical protein
MGIDAKSVVAIATKIASLKKVSSYDTDNEREADRISYGVADIVSAADKLRIIAETILICSNEEEIEDALFQVYEHLNHIHYHLSDMKSFEDVKRTIVIKDQQSIE